MFGRTVETAVRLGSAGESLGPPARVEYLAVDPVAAANGDPSPMRVVSTDPAGAELASEFTAHRNLARQEWDVDASLRVFTQVIRSRGLDGMHVFRSLPAQVGGDPGSMAEMVYDPNGRLVESVPAAADLGATVYGYAGRTSTVTEPGPGGGVTTTTVSLTGLPEQSVDALGTLTCYYHGSGGALRDVVVNPDASFCDGSIPSDGVNRASSHFEYDARGLLTLRDLPGKSAEQVSLNAFGEVWRVQDAAGDTQFTRDRLGRVVQRNDVGEGISTFDWDSDANCGWADGLLRRAVSADGVEQLFDYDVFGRPSARTMTVDDRTLRTSMHYNELGQLGELRTPIGGPRIQYAYDGLGSLTTVSAEGATLWSVQDRDVTGVASDVLFGNGVQSTKTIVEGLLREAHVLAPNATLPYPGAPQSMLEIDSLELEYDARGNTSMRGIPHLGLEETFEHDPLGRLERWTTRSKGNVLQDDITQTYWETGAIRTRSDIGNYIYAGLQVLSAGGVSYTYDADGRQDSRAGFELDWTRRSRLRQSDDGSQVSTYTYDAFDSRAKRVETEQGSSTTTYYDELLEIEVSPSGEVQTFFVPGEDGRIAALKRDAGDEQLEVLYLHTNNLGSASVVTDANGLVVERRDFDPFGRQRPVTWASGDPIFAGEAELDLGFTGHREQEAHGLIDMRGRHYDPHLGRFASADPILAAPYSSQGHDPFAYVYNSPLRFVDPSGFIADPAADGPDSDPDAADYDEADYADGHPGEDPGSPAYGYDYGTSSSDLGPYGGGGAGDQGPPLPDDSNAAQNELPGLVPPEEKDLTYEQTAEIVGSLLFRGGQALPRAKSKARQNYEETINLPNQHRVGVHPALDAFGVETAVKTAPDVGDKLFAVLLGGMKVKGVKPGAIVARRGKLTVEGKAYQKEIDFGQELAERGYDVVVRGTKAGPDIIVGNAHWELKTLGAPTVNAVSKNIDRAARQGRTHVFIDGRGVGLSHWKGMAGLATAVRTGKVDGLVQIRVLTRGGEFAWTP